MTPMDGEGNATVNGQNDDEISLIDLVAVLVRYRRLVVGGTLLAGIVAVAVFFILPSTGLVATVEESYIAETNLVVSNIPGALQEYIPVDPGTILDGVLRSPTVVGEVFAPFEDNPDPTRSGERYLAMVRRSIIGNRLKTTWIGATRRLTLEWNAGSPEAAEEFLRALTTRVLEELGSQLDPQLAAAEETLQGSLERTRRILAETAATAAPGLGAEEILTHMQRNNGTSITALSTMESDLQRVRALRANPSRLVTSGGVSILASDSGQGRTIRVVVTVFAAFFLLVFLAFVLQYARTVRSDPEEMGKLRSAWAGK